MSTPTTHDRLTNYLRATGWDAPHEGGIAGGLWRHPDSGLGLPVPTVLAEGGLDWEQILHRLADVERTTTAVIASRLSGRLVDIANLRAANDLVIADSIPYTAGVVLIRDSWQMFRASATTSMGMKAHIRRYRKTADEIAEEARMGHTKRGSFIIPILMPLPTEWPPPDQQAAFTGMEEVAVPEPDARRVMRTFAESLAAIDAVVVVPESEPTSDGIYELIRAGVSHEFSSALHRILIQPAVAEFSASFEWASGSGPAPATAGTVSIPAAAAERVERVSRTLKAPQGRRGVEVLTGPVVGVHRADDDQSGVVTVQTVRNQRSAHVTVNVSRPRLYEALDWMRERETVVVEGRVHRATHGLQGDRIDGVSPLRSHQLGS